MKSDIYQNELTETESKNDNNAKEAQIKILQSDLMRRETAEFNRSKYTQSNNDRYCEKEVTEDDIFQQLTTDDNDLNFDDLEIENYDK